jgi:hypothetical protein
MTALVTWLASAACVASGLTFASPAGWPQATVSSSMRVGQFVLPPLAGDAADRELVVRFFDGSGGSPSELRLRAVVETPKGPCFIRLTGPAATVRGWEAAFDQFVGSLRYDPDSDRTARPVSDIARGCARPDQLLSRL